MNSISMPVLFLPYIAIGCGSKGELNEKIHERGTGLARVRSKGLPPCNGERGHHPWPSYPIPFLKRQSFKFSSLGHHLIFLHISPLFPELGVILPQPENYEGLLCSGRNFYHLYKSKAMTFIAPWPRKSFRFSKREMQLCNSFFTAVMFQGNLTVMSFPCFWIVFIVDEMKWSC